nr:MAG TPA: hypothetical protein [Caudoviricetes sp.]
MYESSKKIVFIIVCFKLLFISSVCGIEPQWKAYLYTKTDYLSCHLAFNVFFLTCHNTVCHTCLPCCLTPCDLTSSPRFDGGIMSTPFRAICLYVHRPNDKFESLRLSLGILLPISLSVIFRRMAQRNF